MPLNRHIAGRKVARFASGRVAILFIVLCVLISPGATAAATECAAPPVVTADGAICFARLHMATAASPADALTYRAEEHEGYWFVFYGAPKEAGVRGGGGKLRVDKTSGSVVAVEWYR